MRLTSAVGSTTSEAPPGAAPRALAEVLTERGLSASARTAPSAPRNTSHPTLPRPATRGRLGTVRRRRRPLERQLRNRGVDRAHRLIGGRQVLDAHAEPGSVHE